MAMVCQREQGSRESRGGRSGGKGGRREGIGRGDRVMREDIVLFLFLN